MITPYKRILDDGTVKKCPYCGKQFKMTYDLYQAQYSLARFDLIEKRCSQCGREFYFVNVDKSWSQITGISAIYPREFIKGIR